MTRRSGRAVPLHGGYVPSWLSARVARLGALICRAIAHHYGRDELLRRLLAGSKESQKGCVHFGDSACEAVGGTGYHAAS